MPLFAKFAILLAVTAVVASPIEPRQSAPVLGVTLSNSASALSEEYNASTDSTAVSMTSTTTITYDGIKVQCLEICIPEFHCTLYDASLAAIMDVNPGETALGNLPVAQVTCASGLAAATAPAARRPRRITIEATITSTNTTFDGEAVFTDAATGAQNKVGFYIGQDATVGDGTADVSAATVEPESLANMSDNAPAFTCVARDSAGATMGTFFGTARYSYSFAPGVVASFLCSTET